MSQSVITIKITAKNAKSGCSTVGVDILRALDALGYAVELRDESTLDSDDQGDRRSAIQTRGTIIIVDACPMRR